MKDGQISRPENVEIISLKSNQCRKNINLEFNVQQKYPQSWRPKIKQNKNKTRNIFQFIKAEGISLS